MNNLLAMEVEGPALLIDKLLGAYRGVMCVRRGKHFVVAISWERVPVFLR